MLPSALDGRRIAATRTSLAHHFNFVPASVSGFIGIYALVSEGEYFSLPALHSGRDVLTIRMDGTPCDEEPTNRTGKGIPGHKGHSLLDPTDLRYVSGWSPTDQARYTFLVHNKVTIKGTSKQIKAFKHNTKTRYKVEDGQLWVRAQQERDYKNFGRKIMATVYPWRRVVQTREEMDEIIVERHLRGHDRKDRIVGALQKHFKFPHMVEIIQNVLGACSVCKEFEPDVKRSVQAIVTSRAGEIFMFDLFKMPYDTPDGYKYVFMAVDHFTKYCWACPLKTKDPGPIVAFLRELFRTQPMPERWL